MKISAPRDTLAMALGVVMPVMASKPVKPALECMKIEVGNDCVFSATDLEVGIRRTVNGVTISSPGACLVNAKQLNEIVREVAPGQIDLELDGDKINVSTTGATFSLPVLPYSEFPELATLAGDKFVEIASDDMHSLIRRSLYATADVSHSKYGAITGVLFSAKDGIAKTTAMDGRRMAVQTCEATGEGEVIIPTKALEAVLRCLEGTQVRVACTKNSVEFVMTSTTVKSLLVEGLFPKKQPDGVGEQPAYRGMVKAGDLYQAAKLSSIVQEKNGFGVEVIFGDKIIHFGSHGKGSSKVALPLMESEGAVLEAKYNPVFIMDAMRVLDKDDVVSLTTAGKLKPLIMTTTGYMATIAAIFPMGEA